jgi:hypothetical protein
VASRQETRREHGSDSGLVTVGLALLPDDEGRPVYRYKITDEAAGIDHEGIDLHLGASHRPNNTKAGRTLVSLLGAAGRHTALGHKLEGLAFGMLIPIFHHHVGSNQDQDPRKIFLPYS